MIYGHERDKQHLVNLLQFQLDYIEHHVLSADFLELYVASLKLNITWLKNTHMRNRYDFGEF